MFALYKADSLNQTKNGIEQLRRKARTVKVEQRMSSHFPNQFENDLSEVKACNPMNELNTISM